MGLFTTVTLPCGLVLAAAGENAGGNILPAETFDPVSATWTSRPGMAAGHYDLTLLPSGRVLATGVGATAEYFSLYRPPTAMKPQLTSVTVGADGRLVLTGTRFRGASGASSGTTQDSSTNVPHVVLRWLDNLSLIHI